MKLKIWTVAADDDGGTRATVHLTEKAAYEQWVEWRFPSNFDAEEVEDRSAARAFIERGDFHGLWEYVGRREFGEPLDTYAIEEHEIEVPAN